MNLSSLEIAQSLDLKNNSNFVPTIHIKYMHWIKAENSINLQIVIFFYLDAGDLNTKICSKYCITYGNPFFTLHSKKFHNIL